MAKGNDGNLLQHWVECDVAWRLWTQNRAHRLHVILTHGMGPSEYFAQRKNGDSGYKDLEKWLAVAQQPTLPLNPPPVVYAYRECGAGPASYPNSAELLAGLLGRANLQGAITEKDEGKCDALRYKWQRGVKILNQSWRKSLHDYHAPANLDCPWLISMDPMTFLPDPDPPAVADDDAQFRPGDLVRLRPVVESHLASKQPGVLCIFCYRLIRDAAAPKMKQPPTLTLFKTEISNFAKATGLHLAFCESTGANPSLGAVLATDAGLPSAVSGDWTALR
jgi:hypothetical protein